LALKAGFSSDAAAWPVRAGFQSAKLRLRPGCRSSRTTAAATSCGRRHSRPGARES
jgi:hypothetical protein